MSICKHITGIYQPENILNDNNNKTKQNKKYQSTQISTHVVKANEYLFL